VPDEEVVDELIVPEDEVVDVELSMSMSTTTPLDPLLLPPEVDVVVETETSPDDEPPPPKKPPKKPPPKPTPPLPPTITVCPPLPPSGIGCCGSIGIIGTAATAICGAGAAQL
jgi:hypothetical protein